MSFVLLCQRVETDLVGSSSAFYSIRDPHSVTVGNVCTGLRIIHDYNLECYKPLSTWSPSEVIFKD